MPNPAPLRHTRLPLHTGATMPALGFGTLIPDPVATRTATQAALEAGFRLLDTAERYRTETCSKRSRSSPPGRIKRSIVHVESHPYLPEWDLLHYCKSQGIVLQAFAALGHSSKPNLLEEPIITAIAQRTGKTPAQVLLGEGHSAWHRPPDHLQNPQPHPGKLRSSAALPDAAVAEISEGINARVRFNSVVETGVPGFIPRSS